MRRMLFVFLGISFLFQGISQSKTDVEAVKRLDGMYQFVSKDTKVPVNEYVWEDVAPFVNGFAKVFYQNKWGFINAKCLPVGNVNYDSLHDFRNGLAAVKRNSFWGFIDVTGIEIIQVQYERVYDFAEDATTVIKNGEWQIIDKKGHLIRKLEKDRLGLSLVPNDNYQTGTQRQNSIPSTNRTTINGVCPPNMDFEYGNFTNWSCFAGNVSAPGTTNVISVSPSSPDLTRHHIYPATTPSALDYYGGFPINPPDGSGYAIKLGNDFVGAEAERVRYVINVPNDPDYSITFQYSVVLENPDLATTGVPHDDWEQPRFTAKMYDPLTGEYLPCASFTYVASLVPGFLNSPILGGIHSSPSGARIKYKPWSSVYVNLSKYQGRTLYLDFTTSDCTRGGHFGYAYIDVVECGIGAKAIYRCVSPNVTTLMAPPNFQTYQWYDNNFTTLLGTTQNLAMNPSPAINSIFKVIIKPYNNTDCPVCNCSDTLSVKVELIYPAANAGPDKSMCVGGTPLNLGSPPIAGNSYSWSPTSFLSNPDISAPITTTPASLVYILTVTNDSTMCFAKDTVVININPKPIPSFTVNASQCLNGNSYLFTNSSSISAGTLTYLWSFGDGSTSTLQGPAHSYLASGTFTVKLLVTSNAGCKDSTIQVIQVYPKPTVNFNGPTTQCLTGNSFPFSNNSSILPGSLSYSWSFGDGVTSTAISPVHNYTTSGNFLVKLVAISENGCKDSLILPTIVNANPVVNVTTTRSINLCLGNSVKLGATGALSYVWTPIAGLSCSTCNNPSAEPTNTTSYIVRGTGANGCPDYDTVTITVIQPFSMSAMGDTICINETAHLIATGAPLYSWSPSTNLSSGIIANPTAHPLTTTQYRVVGFDSFNCFADTGFVIVAVGSYPTVDLGNNLFLSAGTLHSLTPVIQNGPIRDLMWSPPANLSCTTCTSPVVTIKKDMSYSLRVTNIYGCSGMDSIKIYTFCESGQIYIPNAFTPDGDGINDILMVRGKGIINIEFFRIFNRWGELIFEKRNFKPNDPLYGWNGKIRGVVGPPDVFVYTATVECENGSFYTYKGNVSIIK